jgi:3-oxoadipate enol-lactonase
VTGAVLDGPPGAPVLVLSNSLGTTLALWEPQLAGLSGAFRVLRYDHPGHGTAATARSSSIGDLGRDVLAMLDEHELGRVSFCGLSLGGAVGMWLGIHAPERIDRLVLACTSARFGRPESWQERIGSVRGGGLEAIADGVLALWFSEDIRRDAPALVSAARAMMATADAEGYACCCEALAAWDPAERLGEIRAPTLVIAAGEDAATPPAQGEAISRAIPGARLAVIEGAGHLANLERPEAFTRLVLAHLTGGPAVDGA